jgi:hypothetical protein
VNSAYQYLFHTSQRYLTCRRILRHGAMASLPLRRNSFCDFIAIKNPSSSAGFQPANLGSNCKHNNHYTTENDEHLLREISTRLEVWGIEKNTQRTPLSLLLLFYCWNQCIRDKYTPIEQEVKYFISNISIQKDFHKLRLNWENNIQTNFTEIDCENVI